MKLITIQINCPTRAVANQISEELLNNKLAGSTNIIEGLKSTFHWQGKIESADEVALLAKSRESHFESICKVVIKHHPYETPSIIATEILCIDDNYKTWLLESTAEE